MQISKNQRVGLFALGCIALSIAIYAIFFRGSDEERVRAQLVRLARAVEVDPKQPENPIARLGRIRSEFRALFLEDVAIFISEANLPSSGRTQLADFAAQAPLAYSSVSIEFTSVRIAFDKPSDSAEVTAIAKLSGTRSNGQPEATERRVSLRFRRPDDEFQIDRILVEPPPDLATSLPSSEQPR